MPKNWSFEEARDLMLARAQTVGRETVPLAEAGGRLSAADVHADMAVPPFDRSPYDGYAFRAADSAGASRSCPVRLKIGEEIAAGAVPERAVAPGTAAKILTGAPIPEGADAVVMFEATAYTAETVTLFEPVRAGRNIVRAGEDFRAGDLIAARGAGLDPALVGALAAQGRSEIDVFRRPRVGLLSTGPELAEPGEPLVRGGIYNSNRFTLAAACLDLGAEPVYLGRAGDRVEEIAALATRGLAECDLVISSGGVSVGDYDLTPAALRTAGVEILVPGLNLKPGGACAYGFKGARPVFALSGNPAAALLNFYAVVQPVLLKISGCPSPRPPVYPARLAAPYGGNPGPVPRLLAGRWRVIGAEIRLELLPAGGKAALRGLSDCRALTIVPAGAAALAAGEILNAWPIRDRRPG